jgi:hypothetical protein
VQCGWQIASAFLFVALLTGCVGRPDDQRIVMVPLVKQRPYELVGANLSFEGSIDLVLSTEMPANSSALYVAWWATAGKTDDTTPWENPTKMAAPGCPEGRFWMQAATEGTGQSGYSWLAWCPEQPPGSWNATFHAEGNVTGRVCIITIPTGADMEESGMLCRFYPFSHFCARPDPPRFCKGRMA